MKVSSFRRVESALKIRNRIVELVHELNEINLTPEGEHPVSISADVLNFVDQRCAAKGFMSLILESLHDVEKELEGYGVELDN